MIMRLHNLQCTSCHGLWSRISGVAVAVETEEERIMKVMMMRRVGRTRTRTTTMMMMMMEGCIWLGMWLGQEMRMQQKLRSGSTQLHSKRPVRLFLIFGHAVVILLILRNHPHASIFFLDLFSFCHKMCMRASPESIYMIKGIGGYARQAAQIVMVRL